MYSITIITIVVVALLTAIIFGLTWLGFKSCLRMYQIEIANGKYDKDILKEYSQPKESYDATILSWADIGVNENKLFEDIKEIKSDVDFYFSDVTDLGQLQTIGGDAEFCFSKIKDLKQLKTICGNADFSDSKVTNLGLLKLVKGNVITGGESKLQKSDFKNIEVGGEIIE